LALQATVVSELIHWLLTPRVLAMSVVHAVNMLVIRLEAHGSTTILSPIRGLAAPTVTPILGHTLNEHFIPAKLACDVFWEVITAWCKRCQVIDVSVGPSKLVDIVPATTILLTLGTCMKFLIHVILEFIRDRCAFSAVSWRNQAIVTIGPVLCARVLLH